MIFKSPFQYDEYNLNNNKNDNAYFSLTDNHFIN
jgi:hypothetical protein